MWEERFYELSVAAARQQGMITSAQAARVGVDEAALAGFTRACLLQELDWAVYQLASSSLGPRYAYPYAAWLAISPELFRWERPDVPPEDAVLSHESAARLHGLGAVSAPLMVFTAPDERVAPRATTIHVSPLRAEEVMVSMGVPVTTPHRTILDLIQDWTEHNEMRGVITDAVVRDLVDLRALHAEMTPLAEQFEFPIAGPEFVGYFMPDLLPERLSTRNLRAYATLVSGDRVAELYPRVAQVVVDARAAFDVPGTETGRVADEELSRDIAAEIVGRIASNG
jgi:hypothetical protein